MNRHQTIATLVLCAFATTIALYFVSVAQRIEARQAVLYAQAHSAKRLALAAHHVLVAHTSPGITRADRQRAIRLLRAQLRDDERIDQECARRLEELGDHLMTPRSHR